MDDTEKKNVKELLDAIDDVDRALSFAERRPSSDERIARALTSLFEIRRAFDSDCSSWRIVDEDTAFAPPFGTIRECRVCGCLVGGGPNACVRCVKEEEKEKKGDYRHETTCAEVDGTSNPLLRLLDSWRSKGIAVQHDGLPTPEVVRELDGILSEFGMRSDWSRFPTSLTIVLVPA